MSLLRTENLRKIYNGSLVPVKALDGVSLQIEAGEFTAIKGPSGSGKSTLLHLLGGIDSPSSGRVFIGDQDLTLLSPNAMIDFRLNHIGFVFQAYNLIPVLTALENVEFIMVLQNRPPGERTRKALDLLQAVGLGGLSERKPTQLSGGQNQRVAVARALASEPEFILADEPTANLDSHSADQLLEVMEKLNRERGMTFLFSTHDDRIIRRARRVITLQDGQIVSDEKK